MTKGTCVILAGGVKVGQVKSVVIKNLFSRGVTLQFAPIKFWLWGGGGIFGQVKSVVEKIAFSKGGVALQFAPIKFGWGGLFGQVKSVVKKNCL